MATGNFKRGTGRASNRTSELIEENIKLAEKVKAANHALTELEEHHHPTQPDPLLSLPQAFVGFIGFHGGLIGGSFFSTTSTLVLITVFALYLLRESFGRFQPLTSAFSLVLVHAAIFLTLIHQ